MIRKLQHHLSVLLSLCAIATAFAQAQPDLASLKQLHNQLSSTNSLSNSDVIVIINEHALSATAERLSGLEIKLANNGLLRIKTIAVELRNATANVKIGVQAQPSANSAAINFQVSGKLGNGEIADAHLRLPFRLTDVAFAEDASQTSMLRTLFRDWLSAERWNAVLPPLEIPLQLSQELLIPASRFDVDGQFPMQVSTPDYQIKINFTLAAMLFLNGRAVIALNLPTTQTGPSNQAISTINDTTILENEIERLSQSLNTGNSDLRLRIRRATINSLMQQLAAAQGTDLTMTLKPSRIRSEESESIFKTVNYTDVESGNGRADVLELNAERINQGRIDVRLKAQGEMALRVRGREYGIPYSLSPRGTFAINNETVPLQIQSEGERIILRATPGSQVPINVRVGIEIAGHQISIPRAVQAPADQWLKGITLPTLFERDVPIPRQIEMKNSAGPQVLNTESVRYSLSGLKAKADADELEINAQISIKY